MQTLNICKPCRKDKLCAENNCNKHASFNFNGETKRLYCLDHKSDKMINLKFKKCIYNDCYKSAFYGENNEKISFCIDHKTDGMVNLITKKCNFDNCNTRASYGYENEKSIFCSKHFDPGMVNLIDKKCNIETCNSQASYNLKGSKKAILCGKHKTEGMIDVGKKYCIFNGCDIGSSFNFKGEKNPIYCTSHKKEFMVNVIDKKCEFYECEFIALYNFIDGKSKKFCVQHKEDTMVNKSSRICKTTGCEKYSRYGYEGNIVEYCEEHFKPDMVKIYHKKCIYENCKVSASFNIENSKKAIYCTSHKTENMVDIHRKYCFFDQCTIKASFNFKDEKEPIYCSSHKKEFMVNIIDKKCEFPGCQINPSFNFSANNGKSGKFCIQHKANEMINIRSVKCKTFLCNTTVVKKYRGYCSRCFMYTFPNEKVSRNFKTKEIAVVNYIKEKFNNYDWIIDKIIENGCSLRRPDLFLNMGSHIIIIEIDENCHRNYEDICENKRMMQISQDVNFQPLVFIRFNPDSYKLNGLNHSSCWSIDKRGICNINVNKKNEWNNRLDKLGEIVKYWILNPSEKIIENVHLFYDN